jgi:hypothetical protein
MINVTKSCEAMNKQFRDSVFFNDIRAREDNINERHDGTCKWIF